MSKKFLFLISLVLALSLASAGYGDSPVFKLDFDAVDDANAGGTSTEAGFTSFLSTDSGSEVNGVIIDLSGDISSARRVDPNSNNELGFPIVQEEMYRDFIFGVYPSGIKITLWGLGAGRECKIYIYAYDNNSEILRVAEWTANGAYLLTTDFEGGDSSVWPFDPNWYISTARYYDFNGIAHADELGSISLNSTIDPCSAEGQPFAFANALIVIPYGDYNDVEEAQRPQPFDEEEEVSAATGLSWIAGAYAVKHDIYLGTNFDDVNEADTSDTTGIYRGRQDTTSYDPPGLLELDRTYYWRIDEVNDVGGLTIWPGEVWSFTTLPYFVVENFNSYEDTDELEETWDDYYGNDTAAFLDLIKPDDAADRPVRDGNSVEYSFLNHYSPHYSVVETDLADLPSGIGPDWLEMNVKSLALWFYGQAGNPVNSQMYVSLTDGDSPSHTATVAYGVYDPKEDMNDIKVEVWKEWNIALPEFLDDNPDVNLANVKKIVIGFGDGSASDDGVVYFDDIILHTTRCVLVERPDDFAKVDFYPLGAVSGDCVVNYQEIETLGDGWLLEDEVIPTKNPTDANLVLYYRFDEGDGNKIYPDPAGRLNDPCLWSGTLFNSSLDPPGNAGTEFSTDHAPGIGGTHSLYFTGVEGTRVQCGTYGQAELGIGPDDVNAITLSCWVKWLGPRTWSSYLLNKSQGVLGKRGGWSDTTMVWMLELSAGAEPALALRHYGLGDDDPDLYTAAGRMLTEINRWSHLAATYPNPPDDPNDPNEYARLYINGGIVNSGVWRFSNGPDPNIFLSIGSTMDQNAWPGGCPEGFYGYIDEVRIYDRVLEANEIAYLADPTPEDGNLMIPIPSAAEVYTEEPEGSRIVNFRDFALITDMWLEERRWPE